MREYDIEINGLPHTIQLDDAAAKAYGDRVKPHRPVEDKAAPAPANKQRAAQNK